MFYKETQRGFTLIELLVVVAIIGLLASVVMASLNGARQKARYAMRASDLRNLQTALELYHTDHGSYPVTSSWRSLCGAYGNTSNWIPGLAPSYIPQLPNDPQYSASSNENCYLYSSNGKDYKLLVHSVTEMRADNAKGYKSQSTLIDPARDGGLNGAAVEVTNSIWSWALYTSGATTW